MKKQNVTAVQVAYGEMKRERQERAERVRISKQKFLEDRKVDTTDEYEQGKIMLPVREVPRPSSIYLPKRS